MFVLNCQLCNLCVVTQIPFQISILISVLGVLISIVNIIFKCLGVCCCVRVVLFMFSKAPSNCQEISKNISLQVDAHQVLKVNFITEMQDSEIEIFCFLFLSSKNSDSKTFFYCVPQHRKQLLINNPTKQNQYQCLHAESILLF